MTDTVLLDRSGPQLPARSIFAGRISAMATATCSLIREWRRRYRSRLELASYSHDQRNDLGFAAELDAEIAKPFWKK